MAEAVPSPAAPPAASAARAQDAAAVWARHLLAFWFPGNAFLFLATGPHPWWLAWVFAIPVAVAWVWDNSGQSETRQPTQGVPAWPFDAIVYALAALQIVNILLLARLFAVQSLVSLDFLVAFLVVGVNSGYQIITAHELIHRRKAWERQLGRLLLCTVLYEHFYTEHIRGHHVRVGTPEDPATARFGETFRHFYLRTVPAQFKSAWRLEKSRLGDESMSNLDPRLLRSRVVHGLVLEWSFALGVGVACGFTALLAFLLQASFATRLLEIVNYFEHWGLQREGRQVTPRDSWDTHSWFTYYALIGLSRHADHHARASRPYQRLRVHDEAPMLSTGYVGLITRVMFRNAAFREEATEELRRRGLGPFRGESLRAL